MRILTALRTSYPPEGKSGADIMAERINTFLAQQGHEIVTVTEDCKTPYIYKGVLVTSNRHLLGEKFDWCDVVITHLVRQGEASIHAKRFNKPIFHVVHNADGCTIPAGLKDNYMIFNTAHLQQKCGYGFPSLVVNPLTRCDEWQPRNNHAAKFITLVNCVHNKGHEVMAALATNMPNMRFLGVHGGYGNQLRKNLPNLSYKGFHSETVINTTHTQITDSRARFAQSAPVYETRNEMAQIYQQTKILIVPSISESWSLCAAEAQAIGIPVVCSDLPGLRENMWDSAIYCTGTRAYMDAIIRLQDANEYGMIAQVGIERQRQNEANILQQLKNLNTFMENVVKEKREYNGLPTAQAQPAVSPLPVTPAEKKPINKPGRPKKQ